MNKYFVVRVDGQSWKDPVDVEEFTKRGFRVQDARYVADVEGLTNRGFRMQDMRHVGDKDVFFDGRKVATLFISEFDAIEHALTCEGVAA